MAIEYHWAEGQYNRLPELRPIWSGEGWRDRNSGHRRRRTRGQSGDCGDPTRVCVGGDPVELGLVASLARPGGNATGVNFFSTELVAKRMGLMRQLVPAAARVAVLVNPTNSANETTVERSASGCPRYWAANPCSQRQHRTRDRCGFRTFAGERIDALFVAPGTFFGARRVQLADLAARHAVPAIYAMRDYVEAGGLMSYGTRLTDAFRQVGVYAGQNPQRRQAGRPAGLAGDQVRAWRSMSTPPRRSASPCRRRFSPRPTR